MKQGAVLGGKIFRTCRVSRTKNQNRGHSSIGTGLMLQLSYWNKPKALNPYQGTNQGRQRHSTWSRAPNLSYVAFGLIKKYKF